MAVAASLVASCVVFACVDLESLGSGPPRDAGVDVGDAQARFCQPDSGALFCDDFDDPDVPAGANWPGFGAVFPSPSLLGEASFEKTSPKTPSSAPFAVAFDARRDVGGSRTFGFFAKRLEVPKDVLAVALSADIKVEDLTAIAPLPIADAGADVDAEAPRLPHPHTSCLAFVTTSPSPRGIHAVFGQRAIILEMGTSDDAIRTVEVGAIDYLGASKLAWLRVALAVGEASAVESLVRRLSGQTVTCPPGVPAAALWISLPGATACVEALDGFGGTFDDKILAATLGVGLEGPVGTRVLFDSVRVDTAP